MTKVILLVSVLSGSVFLDGCTGMGAGDEEFGTVTEAFAPAGSDAHFVAASNLPPTLFPGERRVIQITMQNTGLSSPANDWTTTGVVYDLFAPAPSQFGWTYSYLPGTVPVGSSNAFSIVITAPYSSASFRARMNANGFGLFGDPVSIPIAVDANATPEWGCTFLPGSSTVPSTLAPGEARGVFVTVQNTGSTTWPATGLRLVSKDAPVNFWGNTVTALTAPVSPGGTASFWVPIVAPNFPGTYTFQREMKSYSTAVGDFRLTDHCVSRSIVVAGQPPLNASLVSQNFPSTMTTAERRRVTVTMKNTGTQPWAADGSYMLYSLNSGVNLWGVTLRTLESPTPSGSTASFAFDVTGPAYPGSYVERWRMRKTGGTDAAFFGDIIEVPVAVTPRACSGDQTPSGTYLISLHSTNAHSFEDPQTPNFCITNTLIEDEPATLTVTPVPFPIYPQGDVGYLRFTVSLSAPTFGSYTWPDAFADFAYWDPATKGQPVHLSWSGFFDERSSGSVSFTVDTATGALTNLVASVDTRGNMCNHWYFGASGSGYRRCE